MRSRASFLPFLALSCFLLLSMQDPQVRGVVSGTVRTSLYEPVAGARVYVTQSPHSKPLVETSSDESGHYRLEGVPPGRCSIHVSCKGWAGRPSVEVIPEPGGDVAGVDFQLFSAGKLKGVVRSRDGKPIANALVSAAFDRSRVLRYPVREIRTGNDGHYLLEDVPMGYVTVGVHADGYRLASKDYPLGLHGRVDFELKPGGGKLRIRVTDAKAAVPVGEVRFSVLPYSHGSLQHFPSSLRSGTLDETGEVLLSGLPPFEYRVSLVHDSYSFSPRTARRKLAEGGTSVVDFHCQRIDSVLMGGTLTDKKGRPLAGGTLVCRAGSGGKQTRAVTDEKGRFSCVSPLAPGERFVMYLVGGDEVLVANPGPGRSSPEARYVCWGWHQGVVQKDLQIRLEAVPGTKLSGKVIGPDGQSVAGASLRMSCAPQKVTPSRTDVLWATSRLDGTFSFRPFGIPGENLWLHVEGPAGQTVYKHVNVESGGSQEGIVLKLSPPTRIEGVLRNKSGRPIAGARVHLLHTDGQSRRPTETITDLRGRYVFLGAPTGGHKLRFFYWDARWNHVDLAQWRARYDKQLTEPFDLLPGKTRKVDFILELGEPLKPIR